MLTPDWLSRDSLFTHSLQNDVAFWQAVRESTGLVDSNELSEADYITAQFNWAVPKSCLIIKKQLFVPNISMLVTYVVNPPEVN